MKIAKNILIKPVFVETTFESIERIGIIRHNQNRKHNVPCEQCEKQSACSTFIGYYF